MMVDEKDIVPYSDRKKGLAKRLEDAPLERQEFFKRVMARNEASSGKCEWCGCEGRRWLMYPDGMAKSLKMCYQCTELELIEPHRASLPEPESLRHPVGPIIVDSSVPIGKNIIRPGE